MDFRAPALVLWEHTCCQTRYWSAARRCDRCGTQAAWLVPGVSTAESMAHLSSLEEEASPPRPPKVAIHPQLGIALLFGLGFLSILVSVFMAIGAVVELEQGDYVGAVLHGSGAAAGPAGAIAVAVDGWLTHRRWIRLFR
jgi:hypothetical protein